MKRQDMFGIVEKHISKDFIYTRGKIVGFIKGYLASSKDPIEVGRFKIILTENIAEIKVSVLVKIVEEIKLIYPSCFK